MEKYRSIVKNDAGDSDLKIISIYKSHYIDLIFGRNSYHFKPFCNCLDIAFEGLQEDMDFMWKQVFGWKKRH